jgi:pSer/pThr/pTyr-binding forkhead associated (FHA) protein
MSTDKPHLVRLDTQQVHPIEGLVIIGRHPACTFVIASNDGKVGISGRHASVSVDGNAAWLEDLGSTNGTYVRGQRITQRTKLGTGDRFRLDSLEFEFRAAVPAAQAPPPTQVAPTLPAPPRVTPREVVIQKTVEVPALKPEPAKVAGDWISAAPTAETKFLLPEERARMQQQMGAGLQSAPQSVAVPTLVLAGPDPRRVVLAQRDTATQEWTVGSNADADVSIALDGVSGLHAKILRNGDTWTISDLMSANGTFVDGQKINRSHLQSGSQLGFGPVLCTFLLPEGAAFAPSPANAATNGGRAKWPLVAGIIAGLAVLAAIAYAVLR